MPASPAFMLPRVTIRREQGEELEDSVHDSRTLPSSSTCICCPFLFGSRKMAMTSVGAPANGERLGDFSYTDAAAFLTAQANDVLADGGIANAQSAVLVYGTAKFRTSGVHSWSYAAKCLLDTLEGTQFLVQLDGGGVRLLEPPHLSSHAYAQVADLLADLSPGYVRAFREMNGAAPTVQMRRSPLSSRTPIGLRASPTHRARWHRPWSAPRRFAGTIQCAPSSSAPPVRPPILRAYIRAHAPRPGTPWSRPIRAPTSPLSPAATRMRRARAGRPSSSWTRCSYIRPSRPPPARLEGVVAAWLRASLHQPLQARRHSSRRAALRGRGRGRGRERGWRRRRWRRRRR